MEIKTLVVGQLGANCYIVVDDATRQTMVIDPGDDADRIEEALRDSDADVMNILLTHGHPDHSFAAGELQQRFPTADVLMHEADVSQLTGEPDIVTMFYDVSRYIEPRLGPFLKEGDIVQLGETPLAVMHTPGHTLGGLCFVTDKVVFTGDTLFAGTVGRTDLMGGSSEGLIRSIREKLLPLPDDTIIYSGHGMTSTIGAERIGNPWL